MLGVMLLFVDWVLCLFLSICWWHKNLYIVRKIMWFCLTMIVIQAKVLFRWDKISGHMPVR